MKRILSILALAALGVVPTGCTLVGHNGFQGGNPNFSTLGQTSGYTRYLMQSNVGYFRPGGKLESTVGATKFDGFEVDRVKCFLRLDRYGNFDPGYGGLGIASQPGPEDVTLAVITQDTSGDGWVSGGVTANAIARGITSGVAFFAPVTPASAFFLDESEFYVDNLSDFSTGMTEHAGLGGAFGVQMTDQNPGGPQGTWEMLPFDLKVQVMNSVNTQTDVHRDRVGHEIITVHLTQATLWGQSYQPSDVSLDIERMHLTKIDNNNAGARMLAAWTADQFEAAVARGETSVVGSATINGSVTLDTRQLQDNMQNVFINLPISSDTVAALRFFAAGAQNRNELVQGRNLIPRAGLPTRRIKGDTYGGVGSGEAME